MTVFAWLHWRWVSLRCPTRRTPDRHRLAWQCIDCLTPTRTDPTTRRTP